MVVVTAVTSIVDPAICIAQATVGTQPNVHFWGECLPQFLNKALVGQHPQHLPNYKH
jgi:hypothetical protein